MENCAALQKIVVEEEIAALVHYASEKGLDPENKVIGPLIEALDAYGGTRNTLGGEKCRTTKDLLVLYSQLAKLTHPVNGRTLIETEKIGTPLILLIIYTIVFLALAIGNEVLKRWFLDIEEPELGFLHSIIQVQRYVLDYLSPFFWGGLGACVYYLKRLNDFAAERSFDRKQFKGWQLRIWLGAILGAVVFDYIDGSLSTAEGEPKLNAKAVAFLTGVGVRVIYGAIEKMIDFLAAKLNLAAPLEPKVETSKPTPQG